MDIPQIAYRLNDLAFEGNFKIAELQKIRGSSFKNLFSGHSIFEDYFFHTGGRTETQFNVGMDWIEGKDVLRFGIAFSFQRGINLKNPIETISPRIDKFNDFINSNKDGFNDTFMWYHWDDENGKRQFLPAQRVGEIPNHWIGLNNFLFVGKYFTKELSEITDYDLSEILLFFDRILPIYVFIEQAVKNQQIVLNKISKICWNTNGWKYPSGLTDKSSDKNSHEYQNGYGHEEWLFDFEKLIDGFHYAFLQPINKYREKYIGEKFNITLYSVNSDDRKRYWVAEIKNAFIIDEKEEKRVLKEYRNRKWIDEMYSQLAAVNANVANFKEWEERTIFNVRFRAEDVHWYDDEPVPFGNTERISHTRYTLLNRPNAPHPEKPDSRELRFNKNQTRPSQPVIRSTTASDIEYSRLHNEIQNGLLEWLKKTYPDAQKIGLECGIGRASADAALISKDGTVTLFEVKTYNEVRHSIRIALGQLLEYAHYPNEKIATALKIVSHAPADIRAKQYIAHLRKLYSLPISYIQFDHNKKEIIEEI